MKIAFVIQSLARGGAEGQLVTLATALAARGHDIAIVSLNGGGALTEAARAGGVTIVSLGKSGPYDLLRPMLRYTRFIRRFRPDLVHGYMPVANVMALLVKPFARNARIAIGVRASNIDLDRYSALAGLSYRVERALVRFADIVIANSQAGAGLYRPRVGRRTRVEVIANGIDTDLFRPSGPARAKAREALGLPADATVIGTVGRLDPMKDPETFLQAARLAANENPTLQFVSIGTGAPDYAGSLRALAERLDIADRIVWAGARDDVARLYAACDIFTLCSAWGEGFPNVVAEAMACAVPCVVTNVGDAAMVVGDTGQVVPTADPRALADAWHDMLARGTMENVEAGKNARARIVAEYSIERLVERSERAFADAREFSQCAA